jgi:hypothetical protein
MINWIHSHTSYSRKSFSLSFEFVEKNTSLHNRLLVSTSTCNDTHSCSTGSRNSLSWSWGKPDSSLCSIIGVTNNRCISTWTSRVWTFVSHRRLDIAYGGTFRNLIDWKHVSSRNCRFPSTKHVLSWICSLGR